LAAVVRLSGRRPWVAHGDQPVTPELGWADVAVRSGHPPPLGPGLRRLLLVSGEPAPGRPRTRTASSRPAGSPRARARAGGGGKMGHRGRSRHRRRPGRPRPPPPCGRRPGRAHSGTCRAGLIPGAPSGAAGRLGRMPRPHLRSRRGWRRSPAASPSISIYAFNKVPITRGRLSRNLRRTALEPYMPDSIRRTACAASCGLRLVPLSGPDVHTDNGSASTSPPRRTR
jgi:hypothetical protein